MTSAAFYIVIGIALAGCAPAPPPVTFHSDPWAYGDDPGWVLHTDHYVIYTTIKDDDVRTHLCEVMEGALAEYQRVAPGVPLTTKVPLPTTTPLVSAALPASGTRSPSSPSQTATPGFQMVLKPMECYVFGTRAEWEDFTRRQTGIAARTYLQINRGGYTLHDKYVAYNVGEAATLSVAAHEGWHLFASQHFKGRLPPFLEEGISTMFEDIEWQDGRPEWKLTRNRSRLQALRRAVEGNYLYPLGELSQKHAGNVVNESGNHIDAFYAESWGFATFLWAAEDGKYRPMMRRLISDVADGTVFDPTGAHHDWRSPWNPAGVRPLLEHYLGMSLEAIDAEYQKYIRKIAFDEYTEQWE